MTEHQELHAVRMRLRFSEQRIREILRGRDTAKRPAALREFWERLYRDKLKLRAIGGGSAEMPAEIAA